jgi:MFS family permease
VLVPAPQPTSNQQAGHDYHAGRRRAGRHRRPPDRRIPYSAVFAIAEFRWLALAQALSVLGDQFAQVAIALLVYDRTGSALLTALAYALTYLPPIVGGPLLSGLADVFPRRQVMITCDLIRLVTTGLMALPGMPLWAMCSLLFFTVLFGAPFFSARAALLPDILPADKLGVGASVSNIAHQATQVIGFIAGAAVVALLNEYRTLGIDAVSFGLSALIVIIAVKPRPAPPQDKTAHPGHRVKPRRPSMGSVSAEGIRIVFGDPVLRTLMLFGWLAGFYVIPEGLAAPYAHALGGPTITVGLMMAAVPVGTIAGGVLVARVVRFSTQLRAMGALAVLSCAPLAVSLLNPPLWAVLALWLLAGVGGSFQVIASPAFVRALTPQTRARAFGVVQSGLYAVQGIGILCGGVVASAFGTPGAVGVAGVAGLCAAAVLTSRWSRISRRVIASQRPLQVLPQK